LDTEWELERVDGIGVYNFIEVCSGAGGLSTGLIEAGLIPLALIEINKDCCKTLAINHKGVNIINKSMTDIKYDKFINKVDLLTGGVPCQAFSQAGNRKGLQDERGNLFLEFIKMIHVLKPKVFMIENVHGLITHNKGQTFAHILTLFKGYTVKYKLLNSAHYGVPQKRKRVLIVGTKNSYSTRDFDYPQHTEQKILRDVLTNTPPSECSKYNTEKIRLFKLIPPGGCWTSLPVHEQTKYMGKSFNSGGGKRGILRRLSMDEQSLTILCSPSQKQTERCHPVEERPLTVRESARIQTFPDSYVFIGSMSSKYKQIGNAVPVKLAKAMGGEIIKQLHFRCV
jgi:DNA (cytosine-5)-methyltransferase 1